MVSDEDITQAKKDVARFCTEWRKRKRECNEIVDQICESADLKKKDFMNKVGLEVDEDSVLEQVANERYRSAKKFLSHKQVWGS